MENQNTSSDNPSPSNPTNNAITKDNCKMTSQSTSRQRAEQQATIVGGNGTLISSSSSSTPPTVANASVFVNANPTLETIKTSDNNSNSNSTSSSSAGSGGDSKADTEDDEHDEVVDLNNGAHNDDIDDKKQQEDAPCECVQCEVCMAENWWRMAAYHNTLLQQQNKDNNLNDSPGLAIEISENAATGLDLIGSAATLMLSQQQNNECEETETSNDDMLRTDFSMPKLREFYECQKQMGIPNFPEDFDEFWLLVVKARLFNIFKYRGPEAYNRIVLKIRNIARQFRTEVEERERQEKAAAAFRDIITGKAVPDEPQNETQNRPAKKTTFGAENKKSGNGKKEKTGSGSS